MFPMSFDTARHLVTDRHTELERSARRHRGRRTVAGSDAVAAAPASTPVPRREVPIMITGWRRAFRRTRKRAIA
jgi:hypothetical protein